VVAGHVAIMMQATNARTCRLSAPPMSSSPMNLGTVKQVHHIEELILEELETPTWGVSPFSGALDNLHLPGLKVARLRIAQSNNALAAFKSFLARSKPSLKTLELSLPHSFSFTSTEVLSMTELLQSLEELSIKTYRHTEANKLIENLISRPKQQFPNLTLLRIVDAEVTLSLVDDLKVAREGLEVKHTFTKRMPMKPKTNAVESKQDTAKLFQAPTQS
jgi:hypothetical protein